MNRACLRIILLCLMVFFIPDTSQPAAEQRTALVIGNSSYSAGPLKNPVNDAADMAKALQKAGFKVTVKKNANLREMTEAIETFGNSLKRGGVGLFYYAGHGVQVGGANYLLPIGARINKEGDVRYEAVDVGRVLAEMENANNGLNIVILDACRDNPFGRSFRSASRGLAIMANAPTGTFISYSTAAGQVAKDGEGRNSPYTRALLKYMQVPGMTINDVFMNVRQKLSRETGQVPWESSSLVGKFYFIAGKADKAEGEAKADGAKPEESGTASVERDDEQQKLEAEREKLRKEKELLKQKEDLARERRELEEKKKQLESMEKQPPDAAPRVIRQDGRFIAYSNGTVLDTKTNLMWAMRDNGADINWYDAQKFCKDYRGGGYSDWRMPTTAELKALFDSKSRPRIASCDGQTKLYLTHLIQLTCRHIWASDKRRKVVKTGMTLSSESDFGPLPWFTSEHANTWAESATAKMHRALPVRNAR